jgi:hypothetical protein
VNSADARPPARWNNTLTEAQQLPNALFYLDCENEIPLTCPARKVQCSEATLQQLSDDLGHYGLLTDATNCVYYDANPSDKKWSAEQLSGMIWVAPEYEVSLGASIRRVLSGEAADIYNSAFNPNKPVFPKHRSNIGITASYILSTHGDEEAFQRMLRCAVDVNAKNTDGDTALHGAVYYGQSNFVKKLLCLGADVNAVGDGGRTPLHVAIRDLHPQMAAADMAHLLIFSGADVNAADSSGLRPMDYFARWRPEHSDIGKLLMERGAVRGRK